MRPNRKSRWRHSSWRPTAEPSQVEAQLPGQQDAGPWEQGLQCPLQGTGPGLRVRPRRVVTAPCVSSLETLLTERRHRRDAGQPWKSHGFFVSVDGGFGQSRAGSSCGPRSSGRVSACSVHLLSLRPHCGRGGEAGVGEPAAVCRETLASVSLSAGPGSTGLAASHRRFRIFKWQVRNLPSQTQASVRSRWRQSRGAEGWGSGSSWPRCAQLTQPRHWVPEQVLPDAPQRCPRPGPGSWIPR